MTCIVATPLQRDHIHFVDGASGRLCHGGGQSEGESGGGGVTVRVAMTLLTAGSAPGMTDGMSPVPGRRQSRSDARR